MITIDDDVLAVPREVAETGPGEDPSEDAERRCPDCGADLDGEVETDRPLLEDGMCHRCWRATVERAEHKRMHPHPIQRVVPLGPDADATFIVAPERIILVRRGYAILRQPYFDPAGCTDEQLARKIKVRIPFS